MRPPEPEAQGQRQSLMSPLGNPRKPPMRMVGPFFLPWVQEAIRDEEVAVIFLKELWPRIVGDQLAKSTAPLCLRKRTLEIGISGREWERVLQGMAQPLMSKVNEFWIRPMIGDPGNDPHGDSGVTFGLSQHDHALTPTE